MTTKDYFNDWTAKRTAEEFFGNREVSQKAAEESLFSYLDDENYPDYEKQLLWDTI